MMRIGIPKALFFYKYFPFWKAFLETLGQEVVISSDTNKRTVEVSTSIAEGDFCLPLKILYGHLADLRDKNVDAILVPRIISVEANAYTCPKLLGLPDLAKNASIEGLPQILKPVINRYEGRVKYFKGIFGFGRKFTKNYLKIAIAYRKGMLALRKYQKNLREGIIGNLNLTPQNPKLTIGIAGHGYNILDRYTSMNLIERLIRTGIAVRIPEMVQPRDIKKQTENLEKGVFWSFEEEILGAGLHWVDTDAVDGLIVVMAFPCGPDSFIKEILEYEVRERRGYDIPVYTLTIDEHSGDAGFRTRTEAFTDMLLRKGRR